MRKFLLFIVILLSFEVSNAQPQHQQPTPTVYRVYLDVGTGKDQGTDDPVVLTLIGKNDQENFTLDNKDIDDNNGGMGVFTIRPQRNLGEIESFKLEVVRKKGKKSIDDIFVRSIQIEENSKDLGSGLVKVDCWIGDGEHSRTSFFKPIQLNPIHQKKRLNN